MIDIAREKYARLMAQIEELEDRVDTLETMLTSNNDPTNPQDAAIIQQELKDLLEQLATKRSELTRLSDGCGKPHPMQ